MSRPAWAAAAVLCLAAAVTACGRAGSITLPVVAGRFGTDPVISLPGERPPGGLVVRTLSEGSGPVVRPGDYVLFDVAAKVWAGDRLVLDTFASHQPQGLPLPAGLPAWRHLAGQRVGSRVLEVVPPKDGFGSRGDASVNVTGTDTLVFVFDILATVPSAAHATGTAVSYRPQSGLPRVTMSAHGPVVTVPHRVAPPKTLVTRVLIAGHGPRLVPGDTVVTQLTGTLWRTGAVFDSSWQHGDPQSFVLGSGQVIPGWNQGLAGQRVGSRVLMVIPPRLGYGKAGNPPTITGNDTLVFVIDVLAATHA
jgi:FKBP-type peptidyl-prolyl cis-trans isomerase